MAKKLFNKPLYLSVGHLGIHERHPKNDEALSQWCCFSTVHVQYVPYHISVTDCKTQLHTIAPSPFLQKYSNCQLKKIKNW